MPSSTTNFGWPYPISSDDLNAGATEIGNLANAADTTMATRAPLNSPALTGTPTATTAATSDNSTRIATTAYVKNNISNRPTSNAVNIEYGVRSVTTDALGRFSDYGLTTTNSILSHIQPLSGGGWLSLIITPDSSSGVFYVTAYNGLSGWGVYASLSLGYTYMKWS